MISEVFWNQVADDILHNFKYAKNIELHILKVVFLLFELYINKSVILKVRIIYKSCQEL